MKKIFGLCFGLIIASPLGAQEYAWPTDASRYLTSSFGESRPRRFHAGIDVKTWNQTGYQAIATRSGYIERMVVSPFGYGRALYVRLDTGESAVYAHLERFNEKLQAVAEREQEAAGEYRIDKTFAPGVFPVQQGEVIAYTGDTGIGVPHLHFEIRDRQGRPLNPLQKNFPVLDQVAPTVSTIALTPLEPGAMIDGDFLPKVYHPLNANGRFVIPDPISVCGKVGFAVGAFDRVSGVNNQFGVYRYQLFIDDSLQFQSQFDRLSFDENPLIELAQDFGLNKQGWGRMHRLYRDPANTLGIYSFLNENAGALLAGEPSVAVSALTDSEGMLAPPFTSQSGKGLAQGEHRFRIVAQDYFGNDRVIEGKLMVATRFAITAKLQAIQANRVICKITAPDHVINHVTASGLFPGRQWRDLESVFRQFDPLASPEDFEIPENQFGSFWQEQDEIAPALADTPDIFIHHGGARVLKLIATDQHGFSSFPVYLTIDSSTVATGPFKIEVNKNFQPQFLRFEISSTQPFAQPPQAVFTAGDHRIAPPLIAQEPERYLGFVPLADIAADSVRLQVAAQNNAGASASWTEVFSNRAIRPRQATTLSANDHNMRVHFNASAVYWPIHGRVTIAAAAGPIGAVYRIEPQDVPLNSGATIEINYPDSTPNPKQLAVAYLDKEKKWQFLDNRLNVQQRTVSAKVFSLQDYTIIRDDQAPTVQIRFPSADGVITNRRPKFIVTVDDSVSGFESERSLEMRLNGNKVIAEYDPEVKLLTYRPKANLTPGNYILAAQARDRCDNVTRREIKFTVQ
ncbi:M23 family metallopeptidase [Cytophagia bacterium CHB2]|nr:M23 family metallopeptidase [Cytophagia bacterium CHB2]